MIVRFSTWKSPTERALCGVLGLTSLDDENGCQRIKFRSAWIVRPAPCPRPQPHLPSPLPRLERSEPCRAQINCRSGSFRWRSSAFWLLWRLPASRRSRKRVRAAFYEHLRARRTVPRPADRRAVSLLPRPVAGPRRGGPRSGSARSFIFRRATCRSRPAWPAGSIAATSPSRRSSTGLS